MERCRHESHSTGFFQIIVLRFTFSSVQDRSALTGDFILQTFQSHPAPFLLVSHSAAALRSSVSPRRSHTVDVGVTDFALAYAVTFTVYDARRGIISSENAKLIKQGDKPVLITGTNGAELQWEVIFLLWCRSRLCNFSSHLSRG